MIGTKKIETFKSDGMVMGQSKGGLHFIKIPDKVFSMKQLMEWWKKIHASYEAEGQVDTPPATASLTGVADQEGNIQNIIGFLGKSSWSQSILQKITTSNDSKQFQVYLDGIPVIQYQKKLGDLLKLDSSKVQKRVVITGSIAQNQILGMVESQLGVKAQTTASTSASRINQMVGTHENPDVNMMRNPFDDRW